MVDAVSHPHGGVLIETGKMFKGYQSEELGGRKAHLLNGEIEQNKPLDLSSFQCCYNCVAVESENLGFTIYYHHDHMQLLSISKPQGPDL